MFFYGLSCSGFDEFKGPMFQGTLSSFFKRSSADRGWFRIHFVSPSISRHLNKPWLKSMLVGICRGILIPGSRFRVAFPSKRMVDPIWMMKLLGETMVVILWMDRNPAPLGNHEKPLFAGIYRGTIIPGCLRWCRIFVHPQY